jgi:hypothetical protein
VGSNTISLNGGNTVTLDSAGQAVLNGVTLSGAGTHTITASYGGADLAFSASSISAQVTVNRVEVSIAGPASLPVQVTVGQAGSVPVTVVGVSAVGAPTGTLSYNLLNSSNVSVASASLPLTAGSASSTATVPLASTLEAGNYTLRVSYGGDNRYAPSASPVAMSIRIGQITPVITWADPAAITYGSNLSTVLNASTAEGNTAVAGTITYTAMPSGGSADTVTSASVLRAGNYTLRADFTPTNTAKYVMATRMVPLTVNKAALTVTADSKSITYGEEPHYTATITGFVGSETAATAVTGAADFSVNPANPSAAGSYTITPALGTLASSNYSFSFVPATLTIGKATPALTLTTSANPALLTTAVRFTVTAPSQATGNVTFYDGTTALGTVAINQGAAVLTTSSLSATTHSITATYSGDNRYNPVTSSAVAQVMTDYSVTGSTMGGSGGTTGSVPTQVVSSGGTALFNVALTPTGTSEALPLSAPMTFTVTDNLPAGSQVALTAPGIPGGRTLTLPEGTLVSGVQLQVQLPRQSAGLHRGTPLTTLPFAFGILMLSFGGKLGRAAGKRVRRSGLLLLLALVGLITIVGLSGCGAVNSGVLAEQHYTITVTATSGSLSRYTTFNLTVR